MNGLDYIFLYIDRIYRIYWIFYFKHKVPQYWAAEAK